jgi:hypothetical protein
MTIVLHYYVLEIQLFILFFVAKFNHIGNMLFIC